MLLYDQSKILWINLFNFNLFYCTILLYFIFGWNFVFYYLIFQNNTNCFLTFPTISLGISLRALNLTVLLKGLFFLIFFLFDYD